MPLKFSYHPRKAPTEFLIHLEQSDHLLYHPDGWCSSLKVLGFSFRAVVKHLTSALAYGTRYCQF